MEIPVAPSIGQPFHGVVRRNAFVCKTEICFVACVEVVINAPVELLSIASRLSYAEEIIQTAEPANVTITRHVQPIDYRGVRYWCVESVVCIGEIVGCGHQR